MALTKFVIKNDKGYIVWSELYGRLTGVTAVDHPAHVINFFTKEEAEPYLAVLKPVGENIKIVQIDWEFKEKDV